MEETDPLLLTGEGVEGDASLMLTCLIEEYARMGWSAAEIRRLFENPFYQATYALRERLGLQTVEQKIHEVISRYGVHRWKINA